MLLLLFVFGVVWYISSNKRRHTRPFDDMQPCNFINKWRQSSEPARIFNVILYTHTFAAYWKVHLNDMQSEGAGKTNFLTISRETFIQVEYVIVSLFRAAVRSASFAPEILKKKLRHRRIFLKCESFPFGCNDRLSNWKFAVFDIQFKFLVRRGNVAHLHIRKRTWTAATIRPDVVFWWNFMKRYSEIE